MSSILCQGLQSCLEPRLIEPRVLRHKLAPPTSKISQSTPWPQRSSTTRQEAEQPRENFHNEEQNNNNNKDHSKNSYRDDEPKNKNNNGDFRGWSFLQALTNLSHSHKEVAEKEKVYVHPLVKLSSSTLSTKSLEMCTESLGSETGSEVSESSDEFPPFSMKSIENSSTIQRSKSPEIPKKLSRSVSFPPPLTSISGSCSFQVRPHREGGRLVMRAVAVPSCKSYFQAERADGRLRLCLVKDGSLDCDNKVANERKEQVCDEEVDKEGVGETEELAAGDDDEEEDEDDDDEEGIGGNIGNAGCEIEIEEFSRPSRCKEGGGDGNKGMPSWGPFWVATS